MQVETLAGQVMAVEVDAGASLAAMRAGIYQEVGIAAKQQRLIILGEAPTPFIWFHPKVACLPRSNLHGDHQCTADSKCDVGRKGCQAYHAGLAGML